MSYKRDELYIKRILESLTVNEMLDILNFVKPDQEITLSSKKEEAKNKLMQEVPKDKIINNPIFSQKLFNEYKSMVFYLEKVFESLDVEDFKKIAYEIKKEKIINEKMDKNEIIYKILTKIPTEELFKSKRLMDRIRPNLLIKEDIEKIEENINMLKSQIEGSDNIKNRELFELRSSVNDVLQDIKKTNIRNDELLGISEYLNIIYDYLLKIHETQKKVNKESIIADDLFWEVLIKEYNILVNNNNRINIPEIRKVFANKYNINRSNFDDFILKFRREGKIRLDIGSPIGKNNVEFLEDSDGVRYYYMTIR